MVNAPERARCFMFGGLGLVELLIIGAVAAGILVWMFASKQSGD